MGSETYIIEITTLVLVFCGAVAMMLALYFKRKIVEEEEKRHKLEKEKRVELFRANARSERQLRQKISSLLHDEIVPQSQLRFKSLEKQLGAVAADEEIVRGFSADIAELRVLIERVRKVSHSLIPELFSTFGLLTTLESLITDVNNTGTARATFNNNTSFKGELPFTVDDQLLIFQCCSEIINNLSKHANFRKLDVSLEDMKNNFTLIFAHNGKGVTNAEVAAYRESKEGIGLKLLEAKAILLNAKIDYSTELEVSYVTLTVPITLKHK